MTFRHLALFTSLACLALAAIWLVYPAVLLAMWGVEFSCSVGLVGRRGAVMFAAISLMFFRARNAPPSPARSALLAGFVLGCFSLAALGAFEGLTGHAGPGIWFSVLIETTLALAFVMVDRRSPQEPVA